MVWVFQWLMRLSEELEITIKQGRSRLATDITKWVFRLNHSKKWS